MPLSCVVTKPPTALACSAQGLHGRAIVQMQCECRRKRIARAHGIDDPLFFPYGMANPRVADHAAPIRAQRQNDALQVKTHAELSSKKASTSATPPHIIAQHRHFFVIQLQHIGPCERCAHDLLRVKVLTEIDIEHAQTRRPTPRPKNSQWPDGFADRVDPACQNKWREQTEPIAPILSAMSSRPKPHLPQFHKWVAPSVRVTVTLPVGRWACTCTASVATPRSRNISSAALPSHRLPRN